MRARGVFAALVACTLGGCWPWSALTAQAEAGAADAVDVAADDIAPDALADVALDALDARADAACDAGRPPVPVPRVVGSVVEMSSTNQPPMANGGTVNNQWVVTRATYYLTAGVATYIDEARSNISGTGHFTIDPEVRENESTYRASIELTVGLYYTGMMRFEEPPYRFVGHGRVFYDRGATTLYFVPDCGPYVAAGFVRTNTCDADLMLNRAAGTPTMVLHLLNASNPDCLRDL